MRKPSATPSTPLEDIADLPLKGRKVIEFCHVAMGPSCGFANGATAKLPRPGVCFRGVTETTSGQSPQFGEHTDELLDELGFSVTEIAATRDAGDIS